VATIVMTGGTSGFGKISSDRLAATPGTRLLLGGRSQGGGSAQVLPLDLARLASVRMFADAVLKRLDGAAIDALILNAGLALDTNTQRTEDGFETTFAVNHLGQYLLLRLLLPRLAHGARVVLTSSGTHDPAQGTILPVPKHASAQRLARPETDNEADSDPKVGGGRAYTSSKLCNVLTAQALRAEPEAAAKHLRVVAYDPGPTPGTGLSRHRSLGIRAVWKILGSPVGRLIPKFSSREAAGKALADLALGTIVPPPDQVYAKLRRGTIVWGPPSELARDADLADALWRESAPLVGLVRSAP
jgi:NAD(P)-dependent dehydrogenase (short-subunit alcohol dehydrogenase family)